MEGAAERDHGCAAQAVARGDAARLSAGVVRHHHGEACTSESQERKLTASYQDEFDDVVKQRLQQAGVRLAAQLRKGLGF